MRITKDKPQRESLLERLRAMASLASPRREALQAAADAIRSAEGYRWVGLYDVLRETGLVTNLVYSGPGAPDYPTFPISKGLTGAAISSRQTVNVGDVHADSRYLSAFASTRSEIIVPLFSRDRDRVVGTLDIESEQPHAFDAATQAFLEQCAEAIRPLWST
jgi:putative methionine-R-sulfoxide reductase with GAF domain